MPAPLFTWLDSVVLDSDHCVQKIKSHEQSDCHKVSTSVEEQRKRNAILTSSLISQKKEEDVTERFLLPCYGLLQCHVPYNRYPFITFAPSARSGSRKLTLN